jgi:hypothetical protein
LLHATAPSVRSENYASDGSGYKYIIIPEKLKLKNAIQID